MAYVTSFICILVYYAIGFAFYAAYWRYSDAQPESLWNKFIGWCWLLGWPLLLSLAVISIPLAMVDSVAVKMAARRLTEKSSKPE